MLVELKNTKVKADHLSQVARYKTFLDGTEASVECVLIVTPGMPDETDYAQKTWRSCYTFWTTRSRQTLAWQSHRLNAVFSTVVLRSLVRKQGEHLREW